MKKAQSRKKAPAKNLGGRPRFEQEKTAKVLGGFSVSESMFDEWHAYREMFQFENDSAFFRHVFTTWKEKVAEMMPKPKSLRS